MVCSNEKNKTIRFSFLSSKAARGSDLTEKNTYGIGLQVSLLLIICPTLMFNARNGLRRAGPRRIFSCTRAGSFNVSQVQPEINIIGFSTVTNLKALCAVTRIYICVFKNYLKYVVHIFTVRGFHNGSMCTLGFHDITQQNIKNVHT